MNSSNNSKKCCYNSSQVPSQIPPNDNNNILKDYSNLPLINNNNVLLNYAQKDVMNGNPSLNSSTNSSKSQNEVYQKTSSECFQRPVSKNVFNSPNKHSQNPEQYQNNSNSFLSEQGQNKISIKKEKISTATPSRRIFNQHIQSYAPIQNLNFPDSGRRSAPLLGAYEDALSIKDTEMFHDKQKARNFRDMVNS